MDLPEFNYKYFIKSNIFYSKMYKIDAKNKGMDPKSTEVYGNLYGDYASGVMLEFGVTTGFAGLKSFVNGSYQYDRVVGSGIGNISNGVSEANKSLPTKIPYELMDDTVELKNWITINRVEEKVKESFEECFQSYRIASPDEFSSYFGEFEASLLEIKMQKICLNINDWRESEEEQIVAFAPIIYKEEELGIYKLFFDLDGQITDDVMIMYSEYYIDRD